eukprot:GSChrysophyteH2.ASY1.ANO1.532.1 assembled CDS
MAQYLNTLRRSFLGSESSADNSTIDYDQAGRDAMAKLGVDASTKDEQGHLTPIWRHPTGGGSIYVGNVYVAESLSILQRFGIGAVVNCTHGHGALPNFHEKKAEGPRYYTFPISQWWTYVNATSASVYAFTDPLFKFIEDAVSSGENVLVHCLAGAHRAGTTGCACLMHFAELDQRTATTTAKSLRPIIDPIGQVCVYVYVYKIHLHMHVFLSLTNPSPLLNTTQTILHPQLPAFLERLGQAQNERRHAARKAAKDVSAVSE